jgi:CheY-like chemotaxis protein
MNILIAEDNDINQQLISLYMRKMGWGFVMVADGRKAVEEFETGFFDAVLMDIDMPVLNGVEAARQIRALNKNMPIVAITAYANENMRDECAEAGFSAFLSKPCSREDIKSVIIECVELSNLSPIPIT